MAVLSGSSQAPGTEVALPPDNSLPLATGAALLPDNSRPAAIVAALTVSATAASPAKVPRAALSAVAAAIAEVTREPTVLADLRA